MIILVLNCGSSSLKYQLLDMKNDDVYDLLAKGLVERIGLEVGCLKHQAAGKEKLVREMPIQDHTVGIQAVLDALLDKEYGCLGSLDDIEAVGHRVVHGGEEFFCSALVTDKVVSQIRKCCEIAPLHNPAAEGALGRVEQPQQGLEQLHGPSSPGRGSMVAMTFA